MIDRVRKCLRDCRWLIATSYLLQAFTVMVSVLALWFAVDILLVDGPTWHVAVEIAVAGINAELFVSQAAARVRLKDVRRQLRGME